MAVVLGLLPVAVVVWAVVDVIRQPPAALSTGQKVAWVAALVVGLLVVALVGLIVAVVYLAAVRPRLRRKVS